MQSNYHHVYLPIQCRILMRYTTGEEHVKIIVCELTTTGPSTFFYSYDVDIPPLHFRDRSITTVLSRLKHYVPVLILKIIYNSLFLSHLNYGITAWGFNVGPRIKTLQKRPSDSYLMQSIIHIPLQCLRIFIYYRQWTFSSEPVSIFFL